MTGTFFNSRDVIFDENFEGLMFSDSDNSDDDDLAPPHPSAAPPPSPPASARILPPAPAPPPCKSGHEHMATAKGMVYQDSLVADQTQLAR